MICFTSGARSRDLLYFGFLELFAIGFDGLSCCLLIDLCAVRTAVTERTPGIFLTVSSASFRNDSSDGALLGSTSMEKPTLPFFIIMSLTIPRETKSPPSSGSLMFVKFLKFFP